MQFIRVTATRAPWHGGEGSAGGTRADARDPAAGLNRPLVRFTNEGAMPRRTSTIAEAVPVLLSWGQGMNRHGEP